MRGSDYAALRRKFDAMQAPFTREQEDRIAEIVGDAVQRTLAAAASMRQSDAEVLQRARIAAEAR